MRTVLWLGKSKDCSICHPSINSTKDVPFLAAERCSKCVKCAVYIVFGGWAVRLLQESLLHLQARRSIRRPSVNENVDRCCLVYSVQCTSSSSRVVVLRCTSTYLVYWQSRQLDLVRTWTTLHGVTVLCMYSCTVPNEDLPPYLKSADWVVFYTFFFFFWKKNHIKPLGFSYK